MLPSHWKCPTSHLQAHQILYCQKNRYHEGHQVYSCLFIGVILLKPKYLASHSLCAIVSQFFSNSRILINQAIFIV